ncbi:MAG: hypothetical protein ACOYUK_02390 [Patescibacteria group bacterium]
MNQNKTFDLIRKIEKECPVNSWVVDDMRIWPIVRVLIFGAAERENAMSTLKKSYLSHTKKIIKDLLRVIDAIINDREHNSYRPHQADILFYSSTVNRIKIGNHYYERFFDPIIEELSNNNFTSFSIEESNYREYLYPRNNKSFLIQPLLSFGSLYNFITYRRSRLTYYLPEYERMLTIVKNDLNDASFLEIKSILKLTSLILTYKKIFLAILRRIKPKLVMMTNYYSPNRFALILACRELLIPTADIQHGTQDEMHPAYAHWDTIPPEGYELLPDYFLLWGDGSEQKTYSWIHKRKTPHKIITIGNLLLNKFKHREFSELQKDASTIESIIRSKKAIINILITAQNIPLPDWLFDSIMGSDQSWHWWLRLHPGHKYLLTSIQKQIAQRDIHERITIPEATTLPLYLLLPYMSLHVTQTSSVIIEAHQFNINTILIDHNGAKKYPGYITESRAALATDAKSFREAALIFTQSRRENKERQFVSTNQPGNVAQLLTQILKNQIK